jgi:hypothetical protein
MSGAALAVQRTDFLVDRRDLQRFRFLRGSWTGELSPGEVLLRIDKFGFTSNNVTYALLGDSYGFWRFFPAAEEWGRIPVWGFADVVRSSHDDIAEGERYWGYYPMSSGLLVQPTQVSSHGFVDASPHRATLRAFYNRYSRRLRQPHGDRQEDLQILLRPLFMTAFMLDDFLAERDFFGAGTVILSSASSKLALALAHLLAQRGRQLSEVVGLTSAAHVSFVRSAGAYTRVLPYDATSTLPRGSPIVYVDIAGDADIRRLVHHHFGNELTFSGSIGFAHWDRGGSVDRLPGPQPTPFFVLDQSDKRARDWGVEELQRRFGEIWLRLEKSAEQWLCVVHMPGEAAVGQVYQDMLAGRLRPALGHILSLPAVAA